MERLQLIDDIRTRALDYMKSDPNLNYADASLQAKISIAGEDVKITDYNQPVDLQETMLAIAKKELSPNIRVDLYQEEQLKEMIVANRLGVDLESFINIFLTPEQIHFVTLVALNGGDVTSYRLDLTFDPKKEMQKLLESEEDALTSGEVGYQKKYTSLKPQEAA